MRVPVVRERVPDGIQQRQDPAARPVPIIARVKEIDGDGARFGAQGDELRYVGGWVGTHHEVFLDFKWRAKGGRSQEAGS